MGNEAQKTATEFKEWRKRTTFKTGEISHRARLVQFDLDALAKMEAEGHEVKGYRDLAQKNISALIDLLKLQNEA
jgi:hypothetical protein